MTQISDEILSNTDIVDIISKYVPLKRAGSNFSGLCPFHNEKTPSFMVSPQKQIFKCFGCGEGGNVISFIKEIEKIDFWDAVKILAKDANIDLSEYQKKSKFYEKHASAKEKIKRIHSLAQIFFVNELQKNLEAQKYLKDNRHLSPKLIEKFGIGYAPNSHYDLIKFLKDKGFTHEDLNQASLAKPGQNGEYYIFFKHRITFPIYDSMKNVVAFSARIIDPKDKPKYLNSSEHIAFEKSKILYGLSHAKSHIKEHTKLIVVEGQMDVIALSRLDFPIGIATCGTALTNEHVKLIKRYTENTYLLFDNDKAGHEATIRALKIAYQYDVFPKIIRLDIKYKDVDDVANEPNGKEIFTTALEQAQDGFISIFDSLRNSMDMNSPIDKQKLFNVMFSMIVGLPNPSTQIHYIGLLAEKIGQNIEVVKAQFNQYAKGEGRFIIRQQQKQQEKPQRYQPERGQLIIGLMHENFFKKLGNDKKTNEQLEIIFSQFKQLFPDIGKKLNTLNEDDIEQIKEVQLRWEKEIDIATSDDAKILVLKKILQPIFKKNIQQIQKISTIPSEDKQYFLKLVRELLK